MTKKSPEEATAMDRIVLVPPLLLGSRTSRDVLICLGVPLGRFQNRSFPAASPVINVLLSGVMAKELT